MGETIRAAGVIFVCGDKALFVQRSNEGDHGGEWAFPGGKIEDGESAEEAARRECREEIGRMPKGPLAIHARRISTEIEGDPNAVSVDFTTFVCRVKDEFEPTLNEEHTGYAWAPLAAPPQPMHPGAASSIAKFTMNEFDIAVEIMSGGLTSPQQFMNIWLFDMRITGTGMSFRNKHKEFVVRNPEHYLTPDFLARCNGLAVIVEHPPEATLDTDEYRDRVVGSIMLPYIKGDEVWGIAKIQDEACAMMLTDPNRKAEYSTSPTVVFRKSDGNTSHVIDGQKILIEGKPSFLDHLAICRVGVWDKGGEPNGIVSTRGDFDVSDKETEKKDDTAVADAAKADAARADVFQKMMDSFKADMQGVADSLRADMADCKSKMDSFRSDMAKADAARADAAKAYSDDEKKDDSKKADADEEKKDDSKKADADDEKKDDSKKADTVDEDKKDDAARADALVANHPLVKELREQMVALQAKIPATFANSTDRAAFADVQARADVAYSSHGGSAPAPMMGETLGSYRRRLAHGQKLHSKRTKDVDILGIADDASFGIIEEMTYADSVASSRDPSTVPVNTLRRRMRRDSAGREITEFDGRPSAWMGQFAGRRMAVADIRTPGSLN